MKGDAVTDFAERVAATYGAKPRHHGRELRVYCPVHEAAGDGHNPSLAIWDRGGGLPAYKCMTGCPKDAVKAALKARGISVGNGPVSVEAQHVARHTKKQRKDDATVKAHEFLSGAPPITTDSACWNYLNSRGLGRFHTERTLFHSADPLFERGHALLGVICDLTTLFGFSIKATGIQTLSLNSDGTPRLDVKGKKLRSILGVYQGMAVPLGNPDSKTLVVGEGIETTLAAMQLLDMPFGAAVLSASNMTALIVPDWIEEVVIAADNDEPGISAAMHLQAELLYVGVRSTIEKWGEERSGWDAADELMKRNS